MEDHAVVKNAIATYTPERLGAGVPNFKTKQFRERRHEVLNKLSRLGQGLSQAQQTDFAWFKEAWDDAMLEEYGGEWGNLFAMQAQHILNEIADGKTNAFSVMMHTETRRILNLPALRL